MVSACRPFIAETRHETWAQHLDAVSPPYLVCWINRQSLQRSGGVGLMTLTGGSRPGSRVVAADHVSLRRNNLSVVLRHVRELGPRSRARIAADTGLNKATVSSLVAELDGSGVCGVGAEINVDYLAVTALDLAGDTVSERRVPMDVAHLGPGTTLDRLAELIREAVATVDARGGQVAGVNLAVPGLVQGH